nr:DUF4347 domain-containing protein [uncultured Allomuricauda sp.]
MKTCFNIKALCYLNLILLFTVHVSNAQSQEMAIVDVNYPNSSGLKASLPVSLGLIEVDSEKNLSRSIKQALVQNPEVTSIHLFLPTGNASMDIGGTTYGSNEIIEQFHAEEFMSNNPNVTLLIYSCSLAKNAQGISLMEDISSVTGFNVASCSSCNDLNEEFTFDYSVRPLTSTSNLFE